MPLAKLASSMSLVRTGKAPSQCLNLFIFKAFPVRRWPPAAAILS